MFAHPLQAFLLLLAGFAAGCAFYKHRAKVKQVAEMEARNAKQYIAEQARKVEGEVRSKI